ncbi:MAG: phosphate ABC transporter, permease protein PstA [Candidatus Andersenbacteria bacterium RIFCSPHIGHO2_02_FULL_45_11]|uniref:Phosphate transport system permease protein PstA n=1 Tax=Candidatus Andersenbacteria bacterium RIFCSPHIGHO2_12_FULL_45_11 TaxID=1797281 RepID=A0A1G1X4R8_9BACT|nr:MAG: phosphate ABC transporter, permease protein PstA [Candidatus Andersenbacteria bacterium RIFCSPHIGHO2_01_FULL_46_36]OGY32129.1 MAG: phosphate ABC transporter, permease protein PstA [Candidatus Andersenbacteria bacterium RIFCSPHIGHO2_02_FULL_45_11]OGY34327.1 MAG: phosphate ABC transporter, permease protein PstA [Candidatus Andersenbacteria bacterium RIFCSPHIGHO2_12_FULL_45_11]
MNDIYRHQNEPWWVRRASGIDQVVRYAGVLSILFGVVVLVVLFGQALIEGFPRLQLEFFTSFPSRIASQAGILSAWVGTIWVIVLCALMAVPLGVMTALYLEEYSSRHLLSRILEINIANLAGVPSIIYGLLGLGLFVRLLALGRSVLAGAGTLALLILPIVILATREALRAVPHSLREGSYALGASRWQTIWHQVLPAAFPSILTGIILAVSRAVGETAPLIMIGALTYIAFLPQSVRDPFTVLPIQVFNWVSRPQQAFTANAAAGVVVLLGITLTINAVAIWLRHRYQQKI